ncbi:hypothetical protein PVAND_011279 [Polypedilum vanderplanki]|uniref:Uncharacterized protein n=1 Tax=Polypedilum vanderplanki TaxID=319348 RepID=A0A9J6CIZ5_POLVA|nr:hypothetical protein PVAND_011279 [Polypedilum vanderplanki]
MYYDGLKIRTPQPEDDVITVNRSLGLLVEKYKSSVNIFSREMTFMSGDEMENYIRTYGEQHFRGHYGCISHLTFFLNVKVPNLIQVASRPTIASDIIDWHVIVIARIGNLGFIYEPNFNKSFPTRINQMKCKTKIKAVFKKLGIQPGKSNFRLSVGGGGNFNEKCRSMSFDFIRNFCLRFSQLNDITRVDENFFYGGNDFYKFVTW